MLTPTDSAILGAMAHGHTTEIDRAGFQPEWMESDLGRTVASACVSLSRQGKNVNAMNVMVSCSGIDNSAWVPVVKIFENGYGDVSVSDVVRSAKTEYMKRRSKYIVNDFDRLLRDGKCSPEVALANVSAQLDALQFSGQVYNPLPSSAFNDAPASLMFPCHIPEMNEVMRGGYRPMLMIYVGVTGHGKSTKLYTHAVDVLKHQRGAMVDFVTNELPRKTVVDRILRGLTGITQSEVETRKGSTPERDSTLREWLSHLDAHLRIYEAPYYTVANLRKIVKWDKPSVLLLDYLMDSPGMIPNTRSKDPVGDMAYELMNIKNEFGVCLITGAQMSDDNAQKFQKYSQHHATVVYGSARPMHASNIYVGLKRDPVEEFMSFERVWKDNIGNKINTNHSVCFDPVNWVYVNPEEWYRQLAKIKVQ